MQEANNAIGMPVVSNFYEKKLAKEIYELRDNAKLITHAYTMNQHTGKYVYIGQCIGFGLPYSTQYSNPERLVGGTQTGYTTLPQPEPNGLFTPEGLSATWLMLVDENTGDITATYFEPEIVVTQTKLPKRINLLMDGK